MYGTANQFIAPSAGFEPALMAPEATALSPELRGRVSECIALSKVLHIYNDFEMES